LNEAFFFDVVHAGFASKRKFLANNLGVKFGKEISLQALAESSVSEKARAEEIPLASWKCIAQHLSNHTLSN
jgi:16S rRNA (adenine1518-N6/adenine1519-N6)-dimethyltransferase